MSPTDTPPSGFDDRLQFQGSHRPPLVSGDYELDITLEVRTAAGLDSASTATATTRFAVGGERFAVAKSEIHAVHPPEGSRRDWSGNLAHVVFDRATLPWERIPCADVVVDSPPWFAILVFEAATAPAITTLKAADLSTPQTDPAKGLWAALPAESEQDPDQQIATIAVPWSTLRALAPTWTQLPWTVHARRVEPPGAAPIERAIVCGQQIIDEPRDNTPVAYTAHLVSLEHQYAKEAGHPYRPTTPLPQGAADTVRLVSLYHWGFECVRSSNLLTTMEAMVPPNGTDGMALRLSTETADAAAARYLALGSVPTVHRLRDGGRTVSFLRGPLCAELASGVTGDLPLPARCSDELLLWDEELNIMDASYASAWTLGRLLALSDRDFALALTRWKRARAQHAARLRVELDSAFLPHAAAVPELADFPPALGTFLKDLSALARVPGDWLVSDGNLLPPPADGPGCLRFFDVDPLWVRCLVDGALSIGRLSAGEVARDRDHLLAHPAPVSASGVILRSSVVADHPHFEVVGYRALARGASEEWKSSSVLPSTDWEKLPVVHSRRLAPDTLLVIFDASEGFDLAEFHLPPEALHFGLTPSLNGYERSLRDPSTGDEVGTVSVPESDLTSVSGACGRLLDFDKLARAIAEKVHVTNPTPGDPNVFALQMLESAPCFRVLRRSAP